jgi:hypothetical protein
MLGLSVEYRGQYRGSGPDQFTVFPGQLKYVDNQSGQTRHMMLGPERTGAQPSVEVDRHVVTEDRLWREVDLLQALTGAARRDIGLRLH